MASREEQPAAESIEEKAKDATPEQGTRSPKRFPDAPAELPSAGLGPVPLSAQSMVQSPKNVSQHLGNITDTLDAISQTLSARRGQ